MTTFEKSAPSSNLQDENRALREIISQAAAALPNGAFISPECSIEFMAGLPNEISLVVASLSPEPKAETPSAGAWSPIRLEPLRQGNWNDAPGMGQEADGNYVRYEEAQREIDRLTALVIESKDETPLTISYPVHEIAHDLLLAHTGAEGGCPRINWYKLRAEISNAITVALDNQRKIDTPSPESQMVGVTYSQAEFDEIYEIGKRDGFEEAVQEIDQKTGGDGEYRVSMLIGGGVDDERHTPDAPAMIQRIVDRFEILNLLDDATKTGSDQPDDSPAALSRGSKSIIKKLFEDMDASPVDDVTVIDRDQLQAISANGTLAVRALEWTADELPAAQCIFGHYVINPHYKHAELLIGYGRSSMTILGRIEAGQEATVGDIKASAQADYERRVLSALRESPGYQMRGQDQDWLSEIIAFFVKHDMLDQQDEYGLNDIMGALRDNYQPTEGR